MLNFELQDAADKLVNKMLQLKPGESFIITADTSSNMKVVEAIASSAVAAGALPMVVVTKTPDGVGKAVDPAIPVDVMTAALCECDAWVEVNRGWLLYSTPYEIAEKKNKKMRYINMCDFDEATLVRIIGKVDYDSIKKFMQATHELHVGAKKMRATTPAGTDVSFECDDRHLITCDYGDASMPGIWMCPGQLNIVPKFGTVNGTIVFDGSITPPFKSVLSSPVKLTVENSNIVNVEGGSEAAQFYNWLKSWNDEGMLKMAHMAYGFNPGATLTGNVVEDERIWGAVEWGIGYVSSMDAPEGGQDAASHTDGICLNASVWIDDEQLLDNGKIVHPAVKDLSPVK